MNFIHDWWPVIVTIIVILYTCWRYPTGVGGDPFPSDTDESTRGNFYGQGLTVRLKNDHLEISIGVQTLAHAASYSDWANPFDEGYDDYVRTFAITDAAQFAADVKNAMLNEREDGSSPLSDFLDKMMQAALDDGSEACEYDQVIKHGETSPLERWASTRGEE